VPSFNYGPQPANETLVEENKAYRKEIKALLLRRIEISKEFADSTESTLVNIADAKIAQLEALYTELKAVEAKVAALKARALDAKPYSADFMVKLEDELNDIYNLGIKEINDLLKYLRQARRRAQQQAG
jgi:hypothetical protein